MMLMQCLPEPHNLCGAVKRCGSRSEISGPKSPAPNVMFNMGSLKNTYQIILLLVLCSFAEPHHLYAAPDPGKNFDVAPAPTLLYSKAKFIKRTKV
jgi:hypothetical protein